MAWLPGFEKRIKLTLDNTKVDDTLSDFPVLVKLSDSSGITLTDVTSVFTELGSDANRKKIAVTTSDETTQCYVEIERFDYSNSVAELWIKVPTVVSGTTTDLYLYYDSTQSDNTTYVGDTTDTQAQNVWDSNFKLVMHMAQDPNGDVADAIKDSTINANHGTPAGAMTSADLVDGKIGKAIDFDGGDDYISISSIEVAGSYQLTVEFVCKFPTTPDGIIVEQSVNYSGNNACLLVAESGVLKQSFHNTGWDQITNDTSLVQETDYCIATVYDSALSGAVNTIKSYVTGSLVAKTVTIDTATVVAFGDYGWFLGERSGGGGVAPCDYILSEFRISNTARSAAWIKATYYSNWDGLISFEFEEEEEVTYYISGYVTEGTTPVNRQVYLHNRNTGALLGSTTSSGTSGYFYMETTFSGIHYVVCLDDAAGLDYNDLIYGKIYPTISG